MSVARRRPGTYARERFEGARRNYRRRMRRYVVVLLLASIVPPAAVGAVRGLDQWSFGAGLWLGALGFLALWVWDEPPEVIAKWGRGAQGEKRTANALKPLLRQGWSVRHDVQLTRGNADHVLRSPAGTAFVLETKALAGTISVEDGRLTCRFPDDPSEVRRYDVRAQTDRLVSEINLEWAKRTGRPAPPLTPIVVLWGSFQDRVVTSNSLTFVAGHYLADYLQEAAAEGRPEGDNHDASPTK